MIYFTYKVYNAHFYAHVKPTRIGAFEDFFPLFSDALFL